MADWVCVVKGGCAWQKGGMHGKGGGMHSKGDVCMQEVCVVKGGVHDRGLFRGSLSRGVSVPPYRNERAVRILLECILVYPIKLKYRFIYSSFDFNIG